MVSYNLQNIDNIRRNYWLRGLDSIYDRFREGRKSIFADKDIKAFKQAIVQAQQQKGGGRLTAVDIAQIAKNDFKARHSLGTKWAPHRK